MQAALSSLNRRGKVEEKNLHWWKDLTHPQTFQHYRSVEEWDRYYLNIAREIAKMSKCASRQIGALITVDNRIVATGYNGSPPDVDLCQTKDYECPRKELGLPSGQNLDLCPAVHAEVNAIVTAARVGISVNGGTMYAYCTVPCVGCTGAIISAGIRRVVCLDEPIYHALSLPMFKMAGVEVVQYDKD